MQGPMERPMERARVLTSTLFETLFPAKEAKKREAWLTILLAEEFESLDDLAALDDAGWNSVALPLAIKTELRTASARSTPNSTQLAPDSHATLRDPSWGVRESAADGSTGVGPISFNVANELGRGRFGFVFLCTLSDRPGQYAVKRVDRLRFETEGGKKEIDVLLHAQATEDGGHRNVVHYIQRHTDSVHVYIVMELCDERLDHRMERKGLEDLEAWRTACLELCRGLEYLHTLREPITHRDLKPSNLLFKKNCLKIADMGQSRILAVGETAAPTGSQVFYTCMYINAHVHARSLTRTDAHTHPRAARWDGCRRKKSIGKAAVESNFVHASLATSTRPAPLFFTFLAAARTALVRSCGSSSTLSKGSRTLATSPACQIPICLPWIS